MGRTIAIHLTLTTYGNWLHGDKRGSLHCGRLIGPDPELEAVSRAAISHDAVVLNSRERQLIAQAIGVTVMEKSYRVLAATVQPTHVHLLFAPVYCDIKKVCAELKYRSANAVLGDRRDRDLPRPRSLWTTGRFPVFIFAEAHVFNAIEYIRDHNRRAGLPADPFAWIDPLYGPKQFVGERMEPGSGICRPMW